MKKMILGVALLATIGLTTSYAQTEKKATEVAQASIEKASFGVRGNCNMCKKTIEKAANSVEGVSKAVWSREEKKMTVAFDASKTNEMDVQKAVAASGYDTEKLQGNLQAYSKLPGCCKYDHAQKMSQKVAENK